MLNILRQDKKLIGSHLEGGFSYLVPAMPVDTIKNKIFRKAFFTISEVTLGMRVVTKAADVEGLQNLIGHHPGFEDGFRNFYTFSPQPVPDIFVRAGFCTFFHVALINSAKAINKACCKFISSAPERS
jgi:hypothetical protein